MSDQNDQPNPVLPVTREAFKPQKRNNQVERARHDDRRALFVLVPRLSVRGAVFEVSRMSKSRECLLHDANAASDRKMMCVLEMSGPVGYGLIWLIVETMRKEENLTYSRLDNAMYARIWNARIDQIEEVIDIAITVKLFVEVAENLISAPALQRDVAQLREKQDKWRTTKRNQRGQSQDVLDLSSQDKEEDRTQKTEHRSKKIRTKNLEPRSRDEMETLGKEPHGESGDVWLTPVEHERLKTKFGETFAARCIEKLDAWISQKRTPDRMINGQNAAATLRSWVINAVTEEQAKAEKIQGNGPLKPHQIMSTQQRTAMETVKYFEEREKNANK